MASQISHVAYAQWYLEKNSDLHLDKKRFICGCVFPDIRRICDDIRKLKTHFVFESSCDFENLDSFEAGWKFHIYCDEKREELLNMLGFYSIKDAHINEDASNKLFEDVIIYDEFNNKDWIEISNFLIDFANNNNFSLETRDAVNFWYHSIANYVQGKPVEKTMLKLLSDFNTPDDKCELIVKSVNEINKTNQASKILKNYFLKLREIF